MMPYLTSGLKKYGIFLGFLAIVIALSLLSPAFLSVRNLANIVRQTSIHGIMAVGMTFVILTGGIDLSVGSTLALAGVLCASFEHHGWPLPLVVAATLLIGSLLGLVNGLVITKGKVTPFVVTLGTMSIARGAAHLFTGAQPISGFGSAFRFLGAGELLGVPVPIVLFLLGVVAAAAVLATHAVGTIRVCHRRQSPGGQALGHSRRSLHHLGLRSLRTDGGRQCPGAHRAA